MRKVVGIGSFAHIHKADHPGHNTILTGFSKTLRETINGNFTSIIRAVPKVVVYVTLYFTLFENFQIYKLDFVYTMSWRC